MTELKSILRKVSMSSDAANKLDGMTPARLGEQGWVLKDGNWTKKIPVLQFVSEEHNDGGVAKVDAEVSLDDFMNLVNELAEKGVMPLGQLLEVMNNGLYLHANAKAKPKSITSVKAIEMVFFAAAATQPSLIAKFSEAVLANTKDEFLKAWFAARSASSSPSK